MTGIQNISNYSRDGSRVVTSWQAIVDTEGSLLIPGLHVRDGSCTGPELACDQDFVAEVNVPLTAEQTVVIVVDGSSDHGPFHVAATLFFS